MSASPTALPLPRGASRPGPATSRATAFLRTPKGLLFAVFLPLLALAAQTVGWSTALPHLGAAVLGACLLDVFFAQINGRGGRW